MAQRLTRKLTDVVAEVEQQLKAHYNVTPRELDAWRTRAQNLSHTFPESTTIAIDELYIDYEVQRDVLHKHIINIMKRWDPRICSPGSACRITGKKWTYLYDAQHRTVAAALLGYSVIPCAVVETDDPNFASYAFEVLNDTGVNVSLLEIYIATLWYVTKTAAGKNVMWMPEPCKINLIN